MNVAIVGSRGFRNEWVIRKALRRWMVLAPEGVTVISGGAAGADTLGEQVAREFDLPTTIHHADWNRHGRAAGFIRNKDIVRDADVVLAFFADGPLSKGTSHTVALAKEAGKAVYTYHEGAWTAFTPLALIDECPHCGPECADCDQCEAERRHARSEDARTDSRGVLDPL